MKSISLSIILLSSLVALFSCNLGKGGKADLKTLNDSVSYVLGSNIGANIRADKLEINPDLFYKGLKDGMDSLNNMKEEDKQKVMQKFQMDMQKKQQEKSKVKAGGNIKKGAEFLAKNKTQPDVKETASGLQYKVIKEGTGASPKPTDQVKVHYKGTLIDGTEFDSSVKRGQPVTFQLNSVIPGWIEGLQLMKVGGKYILYVPANLGYGDRDTQVIPAGSTLIFEVELLAINPPAEAKK